MPVRRVNFTHRQRIPRNDVDVVLRRDDRGVFFDLSTDLSSCRFDPRARLFVEAYRQTSVMRFDFGTVSLCEPPTDRYLTEFESETEVLFRLRVTGVLEQAGLLLGEADQLRPRSPDEQPDRRISLLPPVPEHLGDEVWRIEFEPEPLLLVNRNLPDWKQTVRSETFRSLVYPAAFREILNRVLFREGHTSLEDPGDWRSRWLLFATRIPGAGGVPGSREQFDDWVETAVAAFARQFSMQTRYVRELTD